MISTPRYEENEIAKAEDFNYGSKTAVENLDSAVDVIIGGEDFILKGLSVSQLSPASMNIQVAAGAAVLDGGLLVLPSTKTPIPITAAHATLNRIDVIEVRRVQTTFDPQQRAFKDPVSGVVSYEDVDTKIRWEIEVQVLAGTAGSASAPAKTSGWLKIAEVTVGAGVTEIINSAIKNVGTTFYGSNVPGWTSDPQGTWYFDTVVAFLVAYRQKHAANGEFLADAVGADAIDWGTGAAQVKGLDMPIGAGVTGSLTLSDTTTVHASLQAISSFLAANPLVNTSRHRKTISTVGPQSWTFDSLGLPAATYVVRVEIVGANTRWVRHAAVESGATTLTVYLYSDDTTGVTQGPPLGRWGDGGTWGSGVYGERETITIDLWVTKESS